MRKLPAVKGVNIGQANAIAEFLVGLAGSEGHTDEQYFALKDSLVDEIVTRTHPDNVDLVNAAVDEYLHSIFEEAPVTLRDVVQWKEGKVQELRRSDI